MSVIAVELNTDLEKQTESFNSFCPSVVLLKQSFSSTNEPLLYYMMKDSSTNAFLRLTGILWTNESSTLTINVVQCAWSCVIIAGMILMIAFALWDIVTCFMNYNSARFRAVYFLYGVTVFLQATTLILAVVELRRRLSLPTSENETLFLTRGLRLSYQVLVGSLLIGLISPAIYIYLGSDVDLTVVFFVGEVTICCVLTATMYFITTDCTVAISLLEQLIELSRTQTLTFEQFSCVRSDIRSRSAKSSWIYNAIIIVALLDILCVLSAIFLGSYGDLVLIYLIIFPLFLKELPFLCVVYWQVAQVNEASARLTAELVELPWDRAGADNQVRRDIFMSAMGSPIGFSVAGMTLKRKDILIQMSIWSVAFFLGVVRSLVAGSVQR